MMARSDVTTARPEGFFRMASIITDRLFRPASKKNHGHAPVPLLLSRKRQTQGGIENDRHPNPLLPRVFGKLLQEMAARTLEVRAVKERCNSISFEKIVSVDQKMGRHRSL